MGNLRYLSVCSGIEAATQAWHPLGWLPVAFSEIEPFPCAVLHHRLGAGRPMFMPDPAEADTVKERKERAAAIRAVSRIPEVAQVPNFGDMTRFREWPEVSPDVLVGGTPCFPAGTMIATERGFVPIEDVRPGDQALTHLGRFRRVVRVGSKIAPTVMIKGQGHPGFITTANHPFYARRRTGRDQFQEADWVRADALAHHHWACVSAWPSMPVPDVVAIGREKPVKISDEVLMLLAGAYLGDGWGRITDRWGCVLLGLNAAKLEALRPALGQLAAYSVVEMRTSLRVQIPSRPLARWLSENFGQGADDKRVPMWALGLSRHLRDALLRGYQITDGGRAAHTGIRATTVSRQLALTMRSLAVSTGHASSVHFTARPPVAVIEGRRVSQRDTYTVSFSPSDRTSFEDGGFRWQLVRSVAPTGHEERVFDIEVAEDHSYVADGLCVHNCQDYSVAGLRLGMAGSRGQLTLTYVEIAARYRPRWFVWENVPGVLSSNGGRDFARFLGDISGTVVAVPEGGWKNSGIVPGIAEAYGLAFRVLDAQYVRTRRHGRAVPQRRRRVFVVGYLGDWRRAAAVLFDRESLRGDPPPRREQGQRSASTLTASVGGCSGKDGIDGRLISMAHGQAGAEIAEGYGPTLTCNHEAPIVAHALRAEGFDASEDGTGRGTPIVPVPQPFVLMERGRNGQPNLEYRSDGSANAILTPNGGRGGLGVGAVAYPIAIQERAVCENPNAGPDGAGFRTDGAAYTLEARTVSQAVAFDCRAGGETALAAGEVPGALHGSCGRSAVAFSCKDHGADAADEVSPTMRAMGHGDSHANAGGQLAVAFAQNQRDELRVMDAAGALAAEPGMKQQTFLALPWAVRRLIPRECERLQGFPDDFLLIPFRHGLAADGPRYKALGNSMAVNVMEWIGWRIDVVDNLWSAAPRS